MNEMEEPPRPEEGEEEKEWAKIFDPKEYEKLNGPLKIASNSLSPELLHERGVQATEIRK